MNMSSAWSARASIFNRFGNFLRAHPAICLLLLSPGIPEYLSGSSPVNAIILNPVQFIFQLLANLGLYGPGVLLIREAKIRWKKGWASVLLLGAAYGILEEGVALSTLFNPLAGPVGQLGFFGHWLGVSWIWVAGIVPVHMIYSVSLPIILLGLALPETRGKSFLESRRKVVTALAILGVDVFLLLIFIEFGEHFWMGWPILLLSLACIGVLVFLGYKAPQDILRARSEFPRSRALIMGAVGVLFYPSVLFTEFGGMGAKLPASLVVLLVVLVQGIFLVIVLRTMGRHNNERNIIALSAGLVVPIAVFGLVSQISLPLSILVDAALFIFFYNLWKNNGSDRHQEADVLPARSQESNFESKIR